MRLKEYTRQTRTLEKEIVLWKFTLDVDEGIAKKIYSLNHIVHELFTVRQITRRVRQNTLIRQFFQGKTTK